MQKSNTMRWSYPRMDSDNNDSKIVGHRSRTSAPALLSSAVNMSATLFESAYHDVRVFAEDGRHGGSVQRICKGVGEIDGDMGGVGIFLCRLEVPDSRQGLEGLGRGGSGDCLRGVSVSAIMRSRHTYLDEGVRYAGDMACVAHVEGLEADSQFCLHEVLAIFMRLPLEYSRA